MEGPQLENGYTKIANEILEKQCLINLSSYQSRLLFAVFRNTYGFNKSEDWIANIQLIALTGLKKSHVSRTKKELIQRNILVTSSGNKIKFNKFWSQWKELPSKVTVTNPGQKVTNPGQKLPNQGHTKETIQKTITKDTYTNDFLKFWEGSIKKGSKFLAFKHWQRMTPEERVLALSAIENHMKRWEAEKIEEKFIPDTSSWLSRKLWEQVFKEPILEFNDPRLSW
jgi:phage replication O-like protein O